MIRTELLREGEEFHFYRFYHGQSRFVQCQGHKLSGFELHSFSYLSLI